jgi:hypothetical protein
MAHFWTQLIWLCYALDMTWTCLTCNKELKKKRINDRHIFCKWKSDSAHVFWYIGILGCAARSCVYTSWFLSRTSASVPITDIQVSTASVVSWSAHIKNSNMRAAHRQQYEIWGSHGGEDVGITTQNTNFHKQ